jgi:3'-phosphoadenosine 5'-phosphosulfate sulfotransferase (PAPS reductase)/FAD synthetase
METIAVWFSCGAASAVAAKLTIEKYGKTHKVRVLNNPIKEEHSDNMRFLKDVEKWLGVEIEFVVNPRWPNASCEEVWAKGYMSGIGGAMCTKTLKKEARYAFEKANKIDHHVLGFTFDEVHRHNNFVQSERPLLPVLIEAKMTKQMCFNMLQEAGIKLPEIYSLGYPNANCIGCVKATSPTYWNLTRELFPEVFKRRAEQSREIGCRLVRYKNKRIFLDELPADAKGRKMKEYDFECGIFCEERR